MASSIIIEEPSDAEDILCAAMAADYAEVNDASFIFTYTICRLERAIFK